MTPKRGEVYKHLRGTTVEVVGVGINADTKEDMVVFEFVSGKQMMGMALHRFVGDVDGEPRFRRVVDRE